MSRWYPNFEDVIAIHDDQLRRYGGAPGIRDMGLVEMSLYRPQTGYYKDVIEEAAALWESFMMNHPFLDGNKRVAYAVTYTFLRVNGIFILPPRRDLQKPRRLATRQYTRRLKRVSKPLKQIKTILRAWAGFGVMLYGKDGLSLKANTAIGAVKQAYMCFFECIGEAVLIDSKAVIHGDDFDFVCCVIFHGMVRAVMALLHFHRLRAEG